MSELTLFNLSVLADKKPYRPVPYFFFYDLLPRAKSVPPMFWKFTFALWCDLTAPTRHGDKWVYEFRCAKSMRKWATLHGVNKSSATEYTAAYFYSGMFDVKYGFKHIEEFSGQPTIYEYRRESTEKDWRCFIDGLSVAYRTSKEWGMRRQGKMTSAELHEENERIKKRNLFRPKDWPAWKVHEDESEIDSSLAFKLLLAVSIDNARCEAGLRPANKDNVEYLLKEGAGKQESDGSIIYRFKASPKNWLERD